MSLFSLCIFMIGNLSHFQPKRRNKRCEILLHLGENGEIELSARRHVKVLVAGEQGGRRRGERTLSVKFSSQMVPILQTNFKDLRLFDLRHQEHVVERLDEKGKLRYRRYIFNLTFFLKNKA